MVFAIADRSHGESVKGDSFLRIRRAARFGGQSNVTADLSTTTHGERSCMVMGGGMRVSRNC